MRLRRSLRTVAQRVEMNGGSISSVRTTEGSGLAFTANRGCVLALKCTVPRPFGGLSWLFQRTSAICAFRAASMTLQRVVGRAAAIDSAAATA